MFDNDDPQQRESLIQALTRIGLDASEFNSGGGVMHVIVPLIDGYADPLQVFAQDDSLRTDLETALSGCPYEAGLYIATNSLRTSCEIGLMGNDGRTGTQVASDEWEQAESLEEAVSIFQRLWDERDKWLKAYHAGRLASY